jgi:hypothetical protein
MREREREREREEEEEEDGLKNCRRKLGELKSANIYPFFGFQCMDPCAIQN